ncbi:rhamnogalacturonan acetylesterase [Streptomyces sp. NBC_01220]|uniref:Rhamnogalacturonan acetylesterase n=1 Tax=Streptomyces poriferorum TaxID=2798799 RepID=A0ABY9J0H0_9ACTN|nr:MULTISPECIES: rhamnogalacturonan acetylesterase [Streptomyces]WSQ47165.1 rhamnogalacturonan acetylesterase [Streptomyces sp. NBC_01220]MBW5250192.1 rhamnogalacturonan acetylesterase [Streptomyces poriferorum]MBW5258291.1 rhamnogalacturonan acetylesterase [Streptomyces poriferorum]MDP5311174.1 rhamnogalacturonan acetylesterase [Streptomyces sp. Alt4]WLQ59712.1 rhamnogalacturonan acetylesterase [Streptomyces sp. Alt2]
MSLTRRQAAAAVAALPLALATATTAAAHGPGGRPRPRTLHIAGDSTAAQKYADAAPETGWGMALPFFLGHTLTVANYAMNGRSSKSFIDEGRLAALLEEVRGGDLLLIQFGHNDEKTEDPARGTDPYTTYQDYLRQYVHGARSRGARPVLLTPVERRRFADDGTAKPTHGTYPAAMRALAAEERVPLLDLQALTLARWQELGPDGTLEYFNWLEPGQSPNYPDGRQDNTHFRPRGAIEAARLVARALVAGKVLAPRDVRRTDSAIPLEWITWPQA